MKEKKFKQVRIWLWVGIVMVLIQFLLGSITRLTESGLSITEWNVISGIVYPYNDDLWQLEFNKYKLSPQYEKINLGMSLEEFKNIYFWEYFHRMWGRIIALSFIFPFLFFLFNKMLSRTLLRQFLILILLGILEGSLGWIMVSSGLNTRPWVNAYKLSFHLICATVIVAYLYWIVYTYQDQKNALEKKYKMGYLILGILILTQIFLGGVMSGMRAGLLAPTWPDINNFIIPPEVYNNFSSKEYLFYNYEENSHSGILVQFFHRSCAYLIFMYLIVLNVYLIKNKDYEQLKWCLFLLTSIIIQGILGIYTVLNCTGNIPILLGVSHQIWGILSFLFCLNLMFRNHSFSIFSLSK